MNVREPDTQQWEARDTRETTAPARHAADDTHMLSEDERLAIGEEAMLVPKARVSWLAVLGLLLGAAGALVALTGQLAPVAIAAGVLGLILAIGGLAATRKPHVASRPLAITAIVFCLGALALAALYYTGQFDWLTRDDQVGWLRTWLDEQLPWLSRM